MTTKPPLKYSIAFQLRGRFFVTCRTEENETEPPVYLAEIQTYVDLIPLADAEGPTKAEAIGNAILALAQAHRNDLTNKKLLTTLTRPTYRVTRNGDTPTPDRRPQRQEPVTKPAQQETS